MKKLDLKGKNKNELEKLLIKTRKDLLNLKMENAMQKTKNPHVLGIKRREIAMLKTKIRSGELSK